MDTLMLPKKFMVLKCIRRKHKMHFCKKNSFGKIPLNCIIDDILKLKGGSSDIVLYAILATEKINFEKSYHRIQSYGKRE